MKDYIENKYKMILKEGILTVRKSGFDCFLEIYDENEMIDT